MKKLAFLIALLTIAVVVKAQTAPPRPQINVLNPRCFTTNTPTQLEVYGNNLGGQLALVVNGKEMAVTADPANPLHLTTVDTVNYPGPGYVFVQIKATYGSNVLYSTPLAWSYVNGPIQLPDGTINEAYSAQAALPAVCAFRTQPWYMDSAPPPSFFSDDFNRATLGANWTLNVANVCSIYNSSEFQCTSGTSPQTAVYTGASLRNDNYIRATVTNLVGYFIGVAVHADATSKTQASCVCQINNLCEYKELVNGSQTVSLAYSVSFTAGMDIAAQASSAGVSCFVGPAGGAMTQFGPTHKTTLTGGAPALTGSYLSTTNNGRLDNVTLGNGLLPR